MSEVFKRLAPYTKHAVRWHCEARKTYKCKLLVVGGGAGGCSVAWRFARKMKKHCIVLLEPSTAKESRIAYYMKRDLFPFIYWNIMLKGYYHGPETIRTILNPFRD